jgi:DNA topoisomerase IB
VPRRLRRVSPDSPGWTRRRHGRGFVYLDENGARLATADVVRCKALVIPPAWRDVWICPFESGHLQAVGTDDAGRRQYLYHADWRVKRDRAKHDRVLDVGARLPRARSRVDEYLTLAGMPRERVLAAAFRLLDLGLFRVGGEAYVDANGSYGLATIEKRHVRVVGDSMTFSFPAKSGQQHRVTVIDPAVREVIYVLRRRRGGGSGLLAYLDGRRWRDISSRDINEFIKDIVGGDVSAKDFRTWHGTVTAAAALAADVDADSATARRKALRRAAEAVSEQLGNTPAVARKSYMDPRVIDKFEAGETITPPGETDSVRARRRAEKEVLRLLED